MWKLLGLAHFVPPTYPRAFPHLRKVKSKGTRRRWVDPGTGEIFEWDYLHGRLEKYDSRGKHLGEFCPESGKLLEGPVKGRKIEV